MTASDVTHSTKKLHKKSGVLMVDTTSTTTTMSTPGSKAHGSGTTTTTNASYNSSGNSNTTMMMMDHDDKYGKRDKQLQRGFAILGLTSCLLIGIIIGTVLIQQEQDLRKRPPPPYMKLLRHAGDSTAQPNALEYSKADAGGIGLFRKPIKRMEPMDKNVKDQPKSPPLTKKGDAVPTIRPKHVEEKEEEDEGDDKENEGSDKDEKEDEEEIDGDDNEEEEDEEGDDEEKEDEKEEDEEKGDDKEGEGGTNEVEAEKQ